MSKGWKILLFVLVMYLSIVALHLVLNIGLDKLGLTSQQAQAQTFRVGYLPVT
jgi:hypothetical protein